MRRKAVIDRLYLFFWFFPIVLLPFTWVNAVVQGAEILGLIQGSGFVVSRNFPALIVFYLVISVGLLLPKSLINHYNWQLLYFSCLLVFTSMFSLLPRLIIGPNGLSEWIEGFSLFLHVFLDDQTMVLFSNCLIYSCNIFLLLDRNQDKK